MSTLLDETRYKDFKTSRGHNYHYYSVAPANGKATLLCLHGFPTGSLDWSNVVNYFTPKGYGAIVPDLLGYGGTDKPTDPREYRMKLMAADIIEILDAEKTEKVISIAHDWGCGLNSGLAIYYGERFEAFAFFAIAYAPPARFDLDAINENSKKLLGYENFGYWYFFAKNEAAQIIEEHFPSFACLINAKESGIGRNYFCRNGQLEKWLLADSKCEVTPLAHSEKTRKQHESLLKGGFTGPLCWYKAMTQGHTPKDYEEIPESRYEVKKPVFFGAALKDPTGPSEFTKATIANFCPRSTIVDFKTSHWVLDEAPHKVNAELEKWIDALRQIKL